MQRVASFCFLLTFALIAWAPGLNSARQASPYLFIWAGDADRKDSDFLAVIDVRASEPTYGQVVATLPVGHRATQPHHTEYEFPSQGIVFANGWAAGRTFLIDLRDPRKPRLAGQFTRAGGYGHPHSFARLPNGNVLATFQSRGRGYFPPGGLVELDRRGRTLRAASAASQSFDDSLIWPYSLALLPQVDRVVTTSTQMGLPKWLPSAAHHASPHAHNYYETSHVQIWSLHDLRLLTTISLPAPPQGKHHLYPAEPRAMPDGSVYVNTFSCGLYRLTGLGGPEPKVEFIYAFPGGENWDVPCALPAMYGRFLIQTVAALPGLIVLDVSDPAKPVEVSRLVLGEAFKLPHWLAVDHGSPRLVIAGNDLSWVLIANIDPQTGKLSLDENFRERGGTLSGVNFHRERWPHGATGPASVHGALFGP